MGVAQSSEIKRAKKREYYEQNKAVILARNKIAHRQNSTKRSAYLKEYRKTHIRKNPKVSNPVYNAEYRSKNRTVLDAKHRKWRNANKEVLIAKAKAFRFIYKEKIFLKKKAYADRNAEKIATYQKNYKETHAAKLRAARRTESALEKARKRISRAIKADPNLRIRMLLRSRIGSALRRVGAKKNHKTETLIGCDLITLRRHLETKFQPGMNWENRGALGWHMDHIKPCTAFDLTNEDEQRKCFHWSNLQPLWWQDNLRKGNKILTLA